MRGEKFKLPSLCDTLFNKELDRLQQLLPGNSIFHTGSDTTMEPLSWNTLLAQPSDVIIDIATMSKGAMPKIHKYLWLFGAVCESNRLGISNRVFFRQKAAVQWRLKQKYFWKPLIFLFLHFTQSYVNISMFFQQRPKVYPNAIHLDFNFDSLKRA